jgi:carbon monoxide dehydrogenase subunit G
MAEVEYSTTAKLPVETIWDFVREIDNWAAYMTGYQSHEKENADDSVWVLKGDVGAMTRTLKFRVHVSEWAGPERVTFELEGLNEQMSGDGEFVMQSYEAEIVETASAPARKSWLQRAVEAVVRFFFRLFRGRAERAASADTGPGEGMARLRFRLEMRPGGPMGPMINAMIKPAMTVAAEDLANRIVGHLETEHPGSP